jgi:hypothetical protein
MKIGYFLLIGLLLAGCSSNQVTLTMRDGAKIESELLSVRDSSIVIQEKGGAPIVIRNEDVSHVFREAPSPVGSIIGFGVFGATIGFATGVIFTPISDCYGECSQDLSAMLTGAAIGAGVGSLLGLIVAPKDKTFYLNNQKDHYVLIDYSKYYGEEPDELKKIQ